MVWPVIRNRGLIQLNNGRSSNLVFDLTVLIYKNVVAGSLLVRRVQLSLFPAEYYPRLGKSHVLQTTQRDLF